MLLSNLTSYSIPSKAQAFGWDGVFGAIGNIASSLIGASASRSAANKQLQATRDTNLANAALAKQQNDWNVQQWQRETEWDSTSAQLQRWKEAGLNPNSFAGVASPVQAPNLQSADLANQQVPDLSALRDIGTNLQKGINDGLSYYLQSKRIDAEIKQINQNMKESESRTNVNNASIREIESKVKLNEAEVRNINQAITESKVKIEDFRSQIRLRAAQTRESEVSYAFLRRTLEARIQAVDIENVFKKAGIELTRQQAKNAAEEYYNIVAQYCLKANEIEMLPFTNWLTKNAALSSAYQGAKDSEKASMLTRIYDGATQILDFLSVGNKNKTVGQSRSSARGRSAHRAWQRQQFGSHANPQLVLP